MIQKMLMSSGGGGGSLTAKIPPMTGEYTPSGHATASSSASDWQGYTRQAWGAMTGNAPSAPSSNANMWLASGDSLAQNSYVQYQHVAPVSAKFFSIGYCGCGIASTAIMQGSNDGEHWTNISDTITLPQSGPDSRSGLNFYKVVALSTSDTPYLYTRLQFLTTTNNNYMYNQNYYLIGITELQVYGT